MDQKRPFFKFDHLKNQFEFIGYFELRIQAVCHAPLGAVVVSDADLVEIVQSANSALKQLIPYLVPVDSPL